MIWVIIFALIVGIIVGAIAGAPVGWITAGSIVFVVVIFFIIYLIQMWRIEKRERYRNNNLKGIDEEGTL
jgi:uncharacterized membrane protein YfcA